MFGEVATAYFGLDLRDRTKTGVKQARGNFDNLGSSINKVKSFALTALGAAGAGAIVSRFAFSTAQSLDDLAKRANRLGTTAEEIDRLGHVGELNAVSIENLEKAWKKSARTLVDAESGLKTARDALDRLQISTRNQHGELKGFQELLEETADKLPRLTSETERLATVQELFGKSGAELLPTLRLGSAGIREQAIEAQLLGVRSTELATKGEELLDSQARLKRAFRGVGDTIAGHTLPKLTLLFEKLAHGVASVLSPASDAWDRVFADISLDSPREQLSRIDAELEKISKRLPEASAELEKLTTTRSFLGIDIRTSKEGAGALQQEINNLEIAQKELLKMRTAAEHLRDLAMERERKEVAERLAGAREILAAKQKLIDQAMQQRPFPDLEEFENALPVAQELPEGEVFPLPPAPLIEDTYERIRTLQDDLIEGTAYGLEVLAQGIGRSVANLRLEADLFKNAWLAAIEQIAAALARWGIFSAANAIFPGAGFLGFLGKNQSGLVPGGGAGAPQTVVNYYEQSFSPRSAHASLSNVIAWQAANTQAARFGGARFV